MRTLVEKLQKVSGYECDSDVISYGLDGILSGFVTIILLVMLSLITHGYRDLLVFLLVQTIGVRHTGGYHAKTRIWCQILTLLSFGIVQVITRILCVCVDAKWICVIGGICSLYICFTAPVLNVKKPMTICERNKNKKKAQVFVIVLWIVMLASLFENTLKWVASSLLSNMLSILVFMFWGRRSYAYEKARNR